MKKLFERIFRPIRSFFKILGEGNRGSLIALLILLFVFLAGALHNMYGFIPWYLSYPLALTLSALSPFVLFGLLWLIFGSMRLSRAMFILDLVLAVMIAEIGFQGNLIPFGIAFGLLLVLATDVLGRCLDLMIARKRFSKSVWIPGLISLVILAAVLIFLLPDGFARGNVDKYAGMQKKETAAPAGFAAFLETGDYDVKSVSYGSGDGFDLTAPTYDLSSFVKRKFPESLLFKLRFDYDLSAVPLSGKIWYPDGNEQYPLLFIIHGNHGIETDSYLGYEYLGEYLASHGYAVISVDENACNCLSEENDARAILLLENIRQVLQWNAEEHGPLYNRFDADNIVLTGHSRGGEAICHAMLFNGYDRYPDNGNLTFDYHFPIRSLIAIAPVCDQYVPAGKTDVLTDVNYLLIHGLNDQDVTEIMGEKQYYNIRFSGKTDCFKSALFINGANHGQFNTLWGRYDSSEPTSRFLDVRDLLTKEAQQQILCTLMKTFLDVTVRGDDTYRSLFYDADAYLTDLPDTAYQQMYADSSFSPRFDFDEQKDIGTSSGNWKLAVSNSKGWARKRRSVTSDDDETNCVLAFHWEDAKEPILVTVDTGNVDLGEYDLSFDLADMRNKKKDLKDAGMIGYFVTFTDENGKTATVQEPRPVFPSIGVQLYKPDALFDLYEYKHQFTTVHVSARDTKADNGFDETKIKQITIGFTDPIGDIVIDEIGLCKHQ